MKQSVNVGEFAGAYNFVFAYEVTEPRLVTAEGAFPKTTYNLFLESTAPPDSITKDGVEYKRFVLNQNICADHFPSVSGSLLLSEERRELILDGPPRYSGKYTDVVVHHAELVEVTENTDVEALYGKYITAVGRFDGMTIFRTHGHSFNTNGLCCYGDPSQFRVIGNVYRAAYKTDRPMLGLLRAYKVGAEDRPRTCKK
jgi:hypothetical protein